MTLTPQDLALAARLSLYRKDFSRFAREQLRVKPKEPGTPVLPFRLNLAQQVLEAASQTQLAERGWIRMVIHKYRQPGGSTWATSKGFHKAALCPNVTAWTIAQDDETSEHIFSINKLFYDSMDPAIKPMHRYLNKEQIVFENPDPRTRTRWPGLRSKITFATAKNLQAGTGHTIHALHLSEASKFQNAKELWTSLLPAIPPMPGTSVIIESTAYFGTGSLWFREFCDRARRPGDEYAFVFLPWSLSKEYASPVDPGELDDLEDEERYLVERHGLTQENLKWRRGRIRALGDDALARELFKQEFPLDPEEAWINLETSVFDARQLYELGKRVTAPVRRGDCPDGPRVYEDPHGPLSIWEEPQVGERYDIGVDVARGLETGDWSVACVLKRRTREQVAEWRGHIEPIDFARPLYWLGRYYQDAQIAVEMDALGVATNDELYTMGYPTLYIWRKHGKGVPQLTKFLGWMTSYESKKKLVTRARHVIAHGDCVVRSAILHTELRQFSIRATEHREFYEGGGAHDDCVMAWMIALTVGLDETFGDLEVEEHREPVRPWVEPGLMDDEVLAGPSGSPARQLAESLKGWR